MLYLIGSCTTWCQLRVLLVFREKWWVCTRSRALPCMLCAQRICLVHRSLFKVKWDALRMYVPASLTPIQALLGDWSHLPVLPMGTGSYFVLMYSVIWWDHTTDGMALVGIKWDAFERFPNGFDNTTCTTHFMTDYMCVYVLYLL